MEEGSVMTRVVSSRDGVGLPVKFRLKQLASNTISRITITEKIDMHALARCRVQKAQDALINCAQGHEGLVENTIPSAEELSAARVGAVGDPAEPTFLARVVAKAQVDTRKATRGQLVMRNVVAAPEDGDSASEGLEPGDVGLGVVLSLPRCLVAKRRVRQVVVDVDPVDGGVGPKLDRKVG
jgi:hypothetical protein